MADAGRPLVFHIDMNAVQGDEVGTLLKHATDPFRAQLAPPAVGQIVLAVDEEGNQCLAEVTKCGSRGWLKLRLDWDSWMPSLQVRVETTPSPALRQVAYAPRAKTTRSVEPITRVEKAA